MSTVKVAPVRTWSSPFSGTETGRVPASDTSLALNIQSEEYLYITVLIGAILLLMYTFKRPA